jgi:hypothetical protein
VSTYLCNRNQPVTLPAVTGQEKVFVDGEGEEADKAVESDDASDAEEDEVFFIGDLSPASSQESS